jgi:hypothetical protein
MTRSLLKGADMSQSHGKHASTSPVQREQFASRLGFILISAGCAIGLGNVWRFPYIVGEYGGAAFVIIYLAFLIILGLPVMIMEFAVGRGSRQSAALALVLMVGLSWLPAADDVLHHRVRMDAVVHRAHGIG